MHTLDSIVIRPARAGDAPGLGRLAQLDSTHVPAGELLVAEVDGRLRAALPVAGGRVLADPFQCSASAVALLRARAEGLHGRPRRRLPRRPGVLRTA